MSLLIQVLVSIVVFWLIFTYLLPLVPEPFATLMLVLLVLAAIIYLLRLTGIALP
jgi:hypothetical protein